MYFYASFSILFYQTADAIDGKQARKLKLSSPLGQLFDHGLDQFSVGLFAMDIFVIFAFKKINIIIFFGQILLIMSVYIANFREYHTGDMIYSNGYIGFTFYQTFIIIMMFVIGVFGGDLFAGFGAWLSYFVILMLFLGLIEIAVLNIKCSYKKYDDKLPFLKSLIPMGLIALSDFLFLISNNLNNHSV